LTAAYIPAALALLGLSDFSLDFKGSTLLLAAMILLSFFWAIISYRRTLPPAGIGLRLFLGFLRFAALLTIIFLIFEPTISRQYQRVLKPLLPVIIDNSQSMAVDDASGKRSAQLDSLFRDPAWNSLGDKFELVYLSAGDSLAVMENLDFSALSFKSIGTNLTSSWQQIPDLLDGEPFSVCILISDGGHNEGLEPVQAARESDAAIYTVGIGDTTSVIDARIASISGSEIAYRGKKSEIVVRIKAVGEENQQGSLELISPKGNIFASKTIRLSGDDLLTEHTLDYTPENTGTLQLKIRLNTTSEEWSLDNNVRTFPVEVLESKIRALLVSGRPNYETAFIVQAAARLPDIEITSLTIDNHGEIYDDQSVNFEHLLAETDLLMVIGFPKQGARSATFSRLTRALAAHPLPVWVWTESRYRAAELKSLYGDDLPLSATPTRTRYEGEAAPDRFYSVLDPDSESSEKILWRHIPPIQTPTFNVRLQGSVKTLVNLIDPATGQSLGPAIAVWESSGRRHAISFGSGYWRWSFLNQGISGGDELYAGLLMKTMRWLVTSSEIQPLTITTDRKLYSSGENVDFSAILRSGDGEIIKSGQIEITLRGPESISKILLELDKNGNYRGVFQPEGVGDYTFEGTAEVNGESIGIDSGSFAVELYNIEKETLRQNRELLQAIASESGGAYVIPDSLQILADIINAPTRTVTTSWQRRIFLNWDLWAIVISLLALEWFIRKRRGML